MSAAPSRPAAPRRGAAADRPPGAERSGGEGLPRMETLRESADYLRCYRRGRRRHGALAVLHFAPNRLEGPRLGITASRKVGKAVVRNRLKRRVREIYRRSAARRSMPPVDLVVHLRPGAGAAGFRELAAELESLLDAASRRGGGA